MKKVLIYDTSNITAYICYGRPALMGSAYAVGKGGLPPTAYAYNVRSWVTHVSSPLFSQSLSYGEHANGGNATLRRCHIGHGLAASSYSNNTPNGLMTVLR